MASKRAEPSKRQGHAAVSFGQKLYVWGGEGGSSKTIPTTTVQTFGVSSETWEQHRRMQGFLPDNLCNMAVASDGEIAYFFGGRSGSRDKYTYTDSLCKLNLSTLQCTKLVARNHTHAPEKKSHSGMVYFNKALVIYGGYTAVTGHEQTDELHVFDLRTSECEEFDHVETPNPTSNVLLLPSLG